MMPEQVVGLATADGARLEALASLPPAPRGAIVVCHPHPLYGGDMDNPVVVRVVEASAGLGFATLRFNFRGVGRSTGTHDGGGAEQSDVVAALGHLAASVGTDVPLALAGYSFGAAVVTTLVTAQRGMATPLAGIALIAPPLAMARAIPWPALATCPASLLVVAGDADHICPKADLAAFARAVPNAAVRTIAGADHFFFGKLHPLGEHVTAWARAL
jgi:alpha/beta superfamily hydrolase